MANLIDDFQPDGKDAVEDPETLKSDIHGLVQITLRLDAFHYSELVREAKVTRTPFRQIVSDLIEEHLKASDSEPDNSRNALNNRLSNADLNAALDTALKHWSKNEPWSRGSLIPTNNLKGRKWKLLER